MPKLPKIWTPFSNSAKAQKYPTIARNPTPQTTKIIPSQSPAQNVNTTPTYKNNHSPLDKQCPTFIKQKEIVAIKTTARVDFKTALSTYDQRHTHQPTTYS